MEKNRRQLWSLKQQYLEPGTTFKTQSTLKQQFSTAYTQQLTEKQQTIEQSYSILDKLKDSQIENIINQVVQNSSEELRQQFQLQCKQITGDMIQNYTTENIQFLYDNLSICSDIQYKNQILTELFDKYMKEDKWFDACNIIIKYQYILSNGKDQQPLQLKLINNLIQENKEDCLYQVCFLLQENLSNKDLKDVIYELSSYDETQLIKNCLKILNGQITNQIKLGFIRENYIIDKLAIEQHGRTLTSQEPLTSSFLSYAFHVMSTGLIKQQNVDQQWSQWRLFSYFQQIGIIAKDDPKIPQVYNQVFENPTKNGYKLGGCLAGLSIQFIHQDVTDLFTKCLEIVENINNFSKEDKVPLLYSLGMTIGLISLGNNDSTIKEILYNNITPDNDVMINYGIMLGLGMASFGNVSEYQSKHFQQLIKQYKDSKRSKEKQALCIATALLHFNSQQVSDDVYQTFKNDDLMPLIFGLAYYHSNNYKIQQQLLEIAMQADSEYKGKYAILAFSLVVDKSQYKQMLPVLKQLAQSHSRYVRQAVCLTLGLFYSNNPDEEVVKQLIKMMQDSEDLVRGYAIVGLSFVLQNCSGCELPQYQKVDYDPPIGDKVQNTIYKSDYEKEEDFDRAINLNNIFSNEKDWKELYTLLYVNKLPRHLTIQEITTLFRYQLISTHKNLFIQRCMCLGLGIMNCGGFTMKFNVERDTEIIGYLLFLLSFNFYPLVSYLSLCMKPQYVIGISMRGDNVNQEDILLVIEKSKLDQYKVSQLYKNVKANQYEKLLNRTKLSKQELLKSQSQQIEMKEQFGGLKQLTQKSIQQYVSLLQRIQKQDKNVDQSQNEDEDEDLVQLQLPCRCLEDGNESVPVTGKIIQGINICVKTDQTE